MVVMKPPYKTDREIEADLAFADQYPPLRMYRRKRIVAPGHVPYEEPEALRKVIEYMRFLDLRNEQRVARLEGRIMRLEEHIMKFSKEPVSKDEFARLNQLRVLFGLPELKEKGHDRVFSEMVGLLSEYSDEEIDSVEILHSIRGEEE
jgi:hypothetical protein